MSKHILYPIDDYGIISGDHFVYTCNTDDNNNEIYINYGNRCVVNGVFLKKDKNTENILIIAQGSLVNMYTYKAISRNFTSEMINYRNLHLCGGWHFPDVEEKECVTRVFDGKKPMGIFATFDRQAYNDFINEFEDDLSMYPSLYSTKFVSENPVYSVAVCIHGTFHENFDIDGLTLDYIDYLEDSFNEYFNIEQIHFLFNDILKNKEVSNFIQFDYGNPRTVIDTIIAGLLLGYPIETTVSLIKDVLFF